MPFISEKQRKAVMAKLQTKALMFPVNVPVFIKEGGFKGHRGKVIGHSVIFKEKVFVPVKVENNRSVERLFKRNKFWHKVEDLKVSIMR